MNARAAVNDGEPSGSPTPDGDVTAHDLLQPLTSIVLTAQAGLLMIDRTGGAVNLSAIRGLLAEIVEYGHDAETLVRRMRGPS